MNCCCSDDLKYKRERRYAIQLASEKDIYKDLTELMRHKQGLQKRRETFEKLYVF